MTGETVVAARLSLARVRQEVEHGTLMETVKYPHLKAGACGCYRSSATMGCLTESPPTADMPLWARLRSALDW